LDRGFDVLPASAARSSRVDSRRSQPVAVVNQQ